ncbi:hypothetical protein LPJ78_005512 [Coemansia sp. RSA 989]|nr:hypothetical protein LPJ68_005322 [Coemansia sp. RSA 1086]KAJ1861137.1 hypothetical protein LPJ78_005512 [Coemansia sp. RSA 989]KAJ1869176.1 hypothetical protein LPJ55_005532 [Coemansia sp. RSA 990]KAJ2670526.1 hypothetical protein IWW42_003959 [Coemansia sp. RSA 1085]
MSDHVALSHASDQNAESNMAYPTTPSASPQSASKVASPQLAMSSVAHINDSLATPGKPPLISLTGYFTTMNSTENGGTVYDFTPGMDPAEKEVRQFNANDGTHYIEHVPGHCLVFIPNHLSIEYLAREVRKLRKPKPRVKAKEKSGKPTNAFIKYRNDKIAEFKSKNPEISQTEISRMAGEWWRNEPEGIKTAYQQLYQEEKRVYDMNKNKRARTESEVGSDCDARSDTTSIASMQSQLPGAHLTNPMDFGFNLGLDGQPVNFNAGRRRSHTLPLNGFSRSGAKRRISQELRKHLASKSSNAYMAANLNMFGNNLALPPFPQQPQQPAFEFTFTPPQDTSQIGTNAYTGSDLPPLTMPLNPSFPIADFSASAANATPSAFSQHSRTLSNMSTPVSIDNSAFSTGGDLSLSMPTSLPMLNTANLAAFTGDGLGMSAAFNSSGYMASSAAPMDATSAPWPLSQTYPLLSENTSASSGTAQQNQQV